MAKVVLLLLVTIVGSATLLPATLAMREFVPLRAPAIFAFGDSLIDSGNNNFISTAPQANYTPYGNTFFHYPTGRFTNGRHAFDFIANYLGIPFMPPFYQPHARFGLGANFGSAGSGILANTNAQEGVISLPQQVRDFQQVAAELKTDLGQNISNYILSESLYVIVSGSNDFSTYLSNTTLQQTVNITTFIEELLTGLYTEIATLYAQGARRVVVLGLAPLGCSPSSLASINSTTGECITTVNTIAQAYNNALLQLVYAMNSTLPDIVSVIAKPYDIIYKLITNGTSKGFTEGSQGCCGSGIYNGVIRCGYRNAAGQDVTTLCPNVKNFVFWDTEHPTERVYRILAKAFWEGDSSIIEPMSLKDLVSLKL